MSCASSIAAQRRSPGMGATGGLSASVGGSTALAANCHWHFTKAKAPARGMTLVELLTVIGILTALLALSAGAYMRMSRNYKEQSAASQLDVALRQARNAAILANAPAFVEIDVQRRTVVPWSLKTSGEWHFEEPASYGRVRGPKGDAIMRGGEIFPEGKYGKCVKLSANAHVDLGASPAYDCTEGGMLEAYIRPGVYEFTGDNFIFYKNGSYSLKIANKGLLHGNVGGVNVVASHYRVAPGRWTKVALVWDRNSTRLMVDDAVIATGAGASPVQNDYPLILGHESGAMVGLFDEVRVLEALPGDRIELPTSYDIKHTAAPWDAIYFAADGGLSLGHHGGPVSVSFIQLKKSRTVTVSMLGLTSRQEVEKVEAEESSANDGKAPGSANSGAKVQPGTTGARK